MTKLVLLLALLLPAAVLCADGGTSTMHGQLEGTLSDAETQQGIVGANVILVGTKIGTSSDVAGRFSLDAAPIGTYILRISSVGYETVNRTDVVISTGRATQIQVSMHEQLVQLGEEVVSTGVYFMTPIEVTTSSYGMNYEEIRRSAGGLGDVSRLVQTMPGVVTTSDQRNDLVVRGGSPSENLTLVDNVEVPNLNHFASQGTTGGPISMLNNEFINEANFLAGGFPAQYGDRLSSVLNVNLREGNRTRYNGNVDLGLAGFGGLIEGPLGSNGSLMFAARRSYLDLLAGNFGLTAIPHYANYQAKLTYDLNPDNKLWLVSLGGRDDIEFKVDESDLEDPNTSNTQSSGWRTITGLNWRMFWGSSGYATLGISDAYSVYEVDVNDTRLDNNLIFHNRSREGETTVKYDVVNRIGTIGQLTAGVSTKFYRNTFDFQQPFGVQNIFSPDPTRVDTVDAQGTYNTSQSGGYVQFTAPLFHVISLTIGGRYDYFRYNSASRFSPRLGVTADLTHNLKLNTSYGMYYQMPAMVFIYAVPGNESLKPIRADHYVVGVSYFPQPDLKVSVEGYVKEYRDYPVSVQYPSYSLANSGDDYGVLGRLIPMTSEGTGRSEGIELYAQKKLTENLYGQVSYSLSRTRHQALDGIDRPGSFDITNVLSLVGGYKINESWEVSAKFTYATGRPYTPSLQPESSQQNRLVLDLQQVNAVRAPAYHRLDLRADYRLHFSGWNLVTYIEIENVYNRANVSQYVWNEKTGELDAVNQIGFFPFGGFKIEF